MSDPVKYRYLPATNKTPLMHPIIGHLVYGQVYTHPDCEGNPDFQKIAVEKESVTPEPVNQAEPAEAEANDPSAKRTSAGKSGRS